MREKCGEIEVQVGVRGQTEQPSLKHPTTGSLKHRGRHSNLGLWLKTCMKSKEFAQNLKSRREVGGPGASSTVWAMPGCSGHLAFCLAPEV